MKRTIITDFEYLVDRATPAALVAIERGRDVRSCIQQHFLRHELTAVWAEDIDLDMVVEAAWLAAQDELDRVAEPSDENTDRAEVVRAAQVAVRIFDRCIARGDTPDRAEIYDKTRQSLERALMPDASEIDRRFKGRRTSAECAASLARVFGFDDMLRASIERARATIRNRDRKTGDAWSGTRDGVYGLDDTRSFDAERYAEEIQYHLDNPDGTENYGTWA